jgi:hypothetical protein
MSEENKESFNMELEQFNILVDNAIANLENNAGTTINTTSVEVKLEGNLPVKGTEEEYGEDEWAMIQEAEVAARSLEAEQSSRKSTRTITTAAGKVLITDPTTSVEIIYDNAVFAAVAENINPTTVRSRCKGAKIDGEGRLWQYFV